MGVVMSRDVIVRHSSVTKQMYLQMKLLTLDHMTQQCWLTNMQLLMTFLDIFQNREIDRRFNLDDVTTRFATPDCGETSEWAMACYLCRHRHFASVITICSRSVNPRQLLATFARTLVVLFLFSSTVGVTQCLQPALLTSWRTDSITTWLRAI